MKYFQIKNNMRLTGTWFIGDLLDPNGKEVFRWDFRRGQPVEERGSLTVKLVKEGRPLDINFNTWDTLIVSQMASEVFQQFAPKAVQFVKVCVPSTGDSFVIANVIDLADCLDENLSHVERFCVNDPVRPDRAGEISLVLDLHIDGDRAAGKHLFRIKGYPAATIVSADLKEALETAGLSGSKFDDVSTPEIADYRIKFAERQRNRALNGS
jgi:hypothetical protein